jgi:hypothetical protein
MIDFIKESLGWLLVLIVFGFIMMIVLTGGGILSPEYWSLM